MNRHFNSDVGVTLNVFTHASFDRAAEQMARIIDLSEQRGNTLLANVFDECRTTQENPVCKDTDMQGKQRKSS